MKLSEAIRKGSKVIRKQAKGKLFDFDRDGNLMSACVLGAAYIGIHGSYGIDKSSPVYEVYNYLRKSYPELLQGKINENYLEGQLVEMNDIKRLPRYQIVRWLERRGL